MSNKKILLINASLSGGGSERVMALIANELVKSYDVTMCLVREKKDSYALDERICVKRFKKRGKNAVLRILQRLIFIRKNMKQNDCVISFMYDINFFTLIAGLGLHKEVIISERGNPEVDDKRRWVHYGRKWLYPLASKVVFQTRMAMEFFSPKIREKSAIIPNPINSLPDWHHGEKEKTIVAIGRLVPQKNFTLLLDAFNDFHKNHPEYNLTIFGEGNLRPQLEQQVVENKLDGVVSLPGFADDIYAKIKTAGIYVSCSNYEGISNAMMEALAMGIPSVCTDCPVGGAALVINDGINGLLIPVNDKKALVTALNQIADDKEFAKKLCRNALQVRVDYSLEKIGNEWKRLIERKMVKKNLAYSYNEK